MSAPPPDWTPCVGPGWRPLVQMLQEYAKLHEVAVVQVKEKFGGLRFYYGGAPGWFGKLADACEDASYCICEECGRPGAQTERHGWVRTECEECEKEAER